MDAVNLEIARVGNVIHRKSLPLDSNREWRNRFSERIMLQ
jgi:hypothetical protein